MNRKEPDSFQGKTAKSNSSAVSASADCQKDGLHMPDSFTFIPTYESIGGISDGLDIYPSMLRDYNRMIANQISTLFDFDKEEQ